VGEPRLAVVEAADVDQQVEQIEPAGAPMGVPQAVEPHPTKRIRVSGFDARHTNKGADRRMSYDYRQKAAAIFVCDEIADLPLASRQVNIPESTLKKWCGKWREEIMGVWKKTAQTSASQTRARLKRSVLMVDVSHLAGFHVVCFNL
jgi:hypothetical protein